MASGAAQSCQAETNILHIFYLYLYHFSLIISFFFLLHVSNQSKTGPELQTNLFIPVVVSGYV